MKLHYTYEMGADLMVYDIDDAISSSTNMVLPHVFPTQKEADFFAGYTLMHGIAARVYTKRNMPKKLRKEIMILWATIPELSQ